MNPRPVGGERVRAGNVDGYGMGRGVDSCDGFDGFLTELDELKETKNIRYSSFGEVVEIFKKREAAGELDFSDIDPENILRLPMAH